MNSAQQWRHKPAGSWNFQTRIQTATITKSQWRRFKNVQNTSFRACLPEMPKHPKSRKNKQFCRYLSLIQLATSVQRGRYSDGFWMFQVKYQNDPNMIRTNPKKAVLRTEVWHPHGISDLCVPLYPSACTEDWHLLYSRKKMLPDGPRPYFSHFRPLTITSAAVKLHCSGATIFLTWELARLSRYVQILRCYKRKCKKKLGWHVTGQRTLHLRMQTAWKQIRLPYIHPLKLLSRFEHPSNHPHRPTSPVARFSIREEHTVIGIYRNKQIKRSIIFFPGFIYSGGGSSCAKRKIEMFKSQM